MTIRWPNSRPTRRSSWWLAAASPALGLAMGAVSSFSGAWAQEASVPPALQGAFQGAPVTPVRVDIDLRSLPTIETPASGARPREVPKRRTARLPLPVDPDTPPPGTPDPLLELQDATAPGARDKDFAIPDLNIAGIGYTNAVPPDTVGEAGPNHYIQMTNDGVGGSAVALFDKAGALLAGPFGLDNLWTAGGSCASGRGDPIALYDPLADRWLLSEFAMSGSHLCVYISQTPDPIAGGWFLYDFSVPQFPDYPKYAAWLDAYYVSSNESDPAAYALDRPRMLNGLPSSFQRFTATPLGAFPFEALIPSDVDGFAPPPAGSPNYFMRHRDDEAHNPGSADPGNDFLEIWEYHVDFADPTLSTFAPAAAIPVAEFDSEICGFSSFFCFPQPLTGTTLDPLREVIMWRLQYRNFGSHETLVGNLVTDVDGTDHGGIRWFELRKSGAGAWSLFQEGTYAPDSEHRWMGSIAMDKDDNIALGYSVSSTSVFPSIRYAGRLSGDPAGTLPQGEHSIFEGSFSQSGTTRWGDYSAMSVDPADDCTLWYTNEYVGNSSGNWATRIANFRFPSCTGAPLLGGAVRGLTPTAAVCRNGGTLQTVFASILRGQYTWDCGGAGLDFAPGDTVLLGSESRVIPGLSAVGGSLRGAAPSSVVCTNLTQAQTVTITPSPGETLWDCEAAGLPVSPGDIVRMIATAQAN